MSLANTTVKASYQGNGVQANFAIPFSPIVNDSAETLVYIRDETVPSAITETLKVEGTANQYTLTGAPTIYDFDTLVTFNVGNVPTATQKVIVIRQLPLTQVLDLNQGSVVPPITLELTFDRIAALIQQLGEVLGRSLKLRLTTQASEGSTTLPQMVGDTALVRNIGNTAFEWRLLSTLGASGPTGATGATGAAGAAGGGGGAIRWIEDALAPIPSIENQAQVYLYEAGLTQNLYADIRVPNGYVAGGAINLRLPYYSPNTSGTALIRTQATLIRMGISAITSTTNQRTSTNSAVTLSGAANLVRAVVLDLSSVTGTINSVAIAAGDIIRVRLYRDADTATSDIRALVYGAEVSFA